MPTGSQRRTIICKCGFIAVGSVREANFKIKAHSRCCELCIDCTQGLPNFNIKQSSSNGMKGVGKSRYGNTVQVAQKKCVVLLAQ